MDILVLPRFRPLKDRFSLRLLFSVFFLGLPSIRGTPNTCNIYSL